MSERVEWVVIDALGREDVADDADQAMSWAEAWDESWPRLAPHRVVKRTITDEQVYP